MPILSYPSPASRAERHLRRAAIVLFSWSALLVPVGSATIFITLYCLAMLLLSKIDPISSDLAYSFPFIALGTVLTILAFTAFKSARRLLRGQFTTLASAIALIFLAECAFLLGLLYVIIHSVTGIWVWDSPADNRQTAFLLASTCVLPLCLLLPTHLVLHRANKSQSAPK